MLVECGENFDDIVHFQDFILGKLLFAVGLVIHQQFTQQCHGGFDHALAALLDNDADDLPHILGDRGDLQEDVSNGSAARNRVP